MATTPDFIKQAHFAAYQFPDWTDEKFMQLRQSILESA